MSYTLIHLTLCRALIADSGHLFDQEACVSTVLSLFLSFVPRGNWNSPFAGHIPQFLFTSVAAKTRLTKLLRDRVGAVQAFLGALIAS